MSPTNLQDVSVRGNIEHTGVFQGIGSIIVLDEGYKQKEISISIISLISKIICFLERIRFGLRVPLLITEFPPRDNTDELNKPGCYCCKM